MIRLIGEGISAVVVPWARGFWRSEESGFVRRYGFGGSLTGRRGCAGLVDVRSLRRCAVVGASCLSVSGGVPGVLRPSHGSLSSVLGRVGFDGFRCIDGVRQGRGC